MQISRQAAPVASLTTLLDPKPLASAQPSSRQGMTMIEVVIAMPVILLALGMLVQMMFAGGGLREAAREKAIASTAAQTVIEEMRNEDFGQLLALYNSDPFDDPGGPGTAPGHVFDVSELTGVDPTAPEVIGEIILPTWNAGSEVAPNWQIREDVANPSLGMPRDLNGDAIVDDLDHAVDCMLLPIMIVLRWRGSLGTQEYQLSTVLAEFYR